jgi:N-methylhydantoinase A
VLTAPDLRLGIDVGGTFTDVVGHNRATGALTTQKLPTDDRDQAESVLAGITRVAGPDTAPGSIVHGTTVVTNALLQDGTNVGARVMLITTEGFRDVLEIARLARTSLYDLEHPGRPAPIVPRRHRLEVRERVLYDGSVAQALTEGEVERVVANVRALQPDAIAICLLHSYANPRHEQMLAAALRDAAPHVCTSSDVNAEFREFERTSTTAVNAALMPVARAYTRRLEQTLADLRSTIQLHIVQSSGGMMSSRTAGDHPIRMLFSGPAAGVAAAQRLVRDLGIRRAVTFDMGGTSTDACLIVDGVLQMVRQRSVGGWPVRVPSVAVESIGAGGGSVAWLDAVGALKVGPRSAGAHPGPACYGRGGVEPTITDADVVLGLLRSGAEHGGGAIRLDAERAHEALTPIAERLGFSVLEAARGVIEVASANMLRAIRLVSVQRGVDPRELTLVAYGGAGPLHATQLARALGIPRVLVPLCSSTFSALGCLTSELLYDVVQTARGPLDTLLADGLEERFRRLEAAASHPLASEGVRPDEVMFRRSADLRYAGQNYEIDVPVPRPCGGDAAVTIRDAFVARHHELYGYATEEPVEGVTLRVSALVPGADFRLEERRPTGPTVVATGLPCHLPGFGSAHVTAYRRDGLPVDEPIVGPALIEDDQSTTLLLPGQTLRADAVGNLVVELA